jgi:glutathione synthase/RimK-type ligase-like ATP-grasp enzyme
VIYKSMSGVRSIVKELSEQDLDAIGRLDACPTQFQQYVDGIDFRVHVVGDEVFSCQVTSSGTDYRYAPATLKAVGLPLDVKDACVRLTRELGLQLSGVDLRKCGDRWYCFEVNPSPAFSYFEVHAQLPISHAIARRLAAGREPERANAL